MSLNLMNVLQRTPTYTGGMLRSLGRVPSLTFSLAAEAFDFIAVQIAAFAASSVLSHDGNMPLIGILGANAVGLACYFSFQHEGLYKISAIAKEMRAIPAMCIRWSILCILLACSALLLHHDGEKARLWIILFYSIGLSGFCLNRVILACFLRAWLAQGNHVHSIAIIGHGESTRRLTDFFADNTAGMKLAGVFGDAKANDQMRDREIAELLELARHDVIDTVIVAEPSMPANQLHALVYRLRQQPLSIYLMPDSIFAEKPGKPWKTTHAFPGLSLFPIADRPINETSLFVKSTVDRLMALLLLLLLAPVMLGCAAGIRLSSPGPILFRQNRIGYKGRDFAILKFRTMYMADCPNDKLTTRNDPRIFRFGMLLRKTSLDELPQLINVLRGEMSLVGPRPHMAQATAAGRLYFDVVSDYAARHRVKPGITGWAQVNGWRGPTETVDQIEARVAHDLYYIENWSLFLDITIMFKTFFVLFGKDVF